MPHAYLAVGARPAVPPLFCQKAIFPSRQEAKRAVKNMPVRPDGLEAHGEGIFNAYKCPHCRCWHLGHKPPKYVRK